MTRGQKRRVAAAVAAAAVALLALSGCADDDVAAAADAVTVVDVRSFAEKVESDTDFDSKQAACIANQVFANFDAKAIEALYLDGSGAIAGSVGAQRYAEILIGCAAA